LDFVYSSIFQEKLKKKKKHFGNWVWFRPQVTEWGTPVLLGPFERANTSRLTGPTE
jgi:hypothetical protein